MSHTWKFFRAGGFDQVRLDTGADIESLGELDPKLWVALSCPTRGLEFDAHTLELLDADKDGRIRVPEVVAAAKWTTSMLKNPDALTKAAPELPLSEINTAVPEGAQLLASATLLLQNLGKADARSISPADVGDTVKSFSKTVFNGDGVIPPAAAEADAETKKALEEILGCVGSVKDLSGMDGVDQPRLDQFFAESAAFLEWSKKSDGTTTSASFEAYQAVKAKVDDFFARCALAAMDPKAAAPLNPSEAEYVSLSSVELSASSAKLIGLPIAKIEAGRALPLKDGLNPAWAAAVTKLRTETVKPIFGENDTLTATDWTTLVGKLASQEAWHSTKPKGTTDKLGVPRLTELTSAATKGKIDALMAKDKALEPQLKAITSVDKLVHFHRDLARFLNNYVAFRDFYTHRAKASFQAGTLYLDGRSCDLCLRVEDPGKHAALATLSMAYLAYCSLTRKGSTEKAEIVAAFTGGDSDYLMAGRNGVFYDRKGLDWDATITRVVDQPISVRQAFWSPYKRMAKFVEDQINGFAAAKDKEGHDARTVGVVEGVKKPEPTAFDIGKFAGVFAAIGLAVGLIGSALAAVLTGFLGLKVWQMPIALAGAMLVISGPSMLLAAMKLRKRSLGPLLDASGWAINARANINIPFGGSLTHLAELPKGSERSHTDPYAGKKTPWGLYLFLAAVLGFCVWAWQSGHAEKWLDQVKAESKSSAGPASP